MAEEVTRPPWKGSVRPMESATGTEDVNEMKFTYPMGTLLIRVVSTSTSV